MSVVVPNALALAGIADGSTIIASDHRNNYAAVQVGANGLIAMFNAAATKGDLLIPSGGGTFDRLPVGANNQVLVADSAQTLGVKWGPAYTDYTPTWTASGVAPVLGNGTLSARYVQIGKTVHYFGQLVMGSTTTFGTGNYSLSLPINRSGVGSASGRIQGLIEMLDSSAGAQGLAIADTAASVSAFAPFFAATYLGVRTQVGQTAPWTWAVGDFLVWNLIYEGV